MRDYYMFIMKSQVYRGQEKQRVSVCAYLSKHICLTYVKLAEEFLSACTPQQQLIKQEWDYRRLAK